MVLCLLWWSWPLCVVVSGSELCSYELAAHKYPGLPERIDKCPKLPVPPRYLHICPFLDVQSIVCPSHSISMSRSSVSLCRCLTAAPRWTSHATPSLQRPWWRLWATAVSCTAWSPASPPVKRSLSDCVFSLWVRTSNEVFCHFLWPARAKASCCPLSLTCSSFHDPHGDHPVHLGCPRLDPHLVGRSWIPWWGHFLFRGNPVSHVMWPAGFCASAGTGVLWWLYIDHRLYGNDTSPKLPKEAKEEMKAELSADSGQALLVYAVSASVFTVRMTERQGNLCRCSAAELSPVSVCRSSCCCWCCSWGSGWRSPSLCSMWQERSSSTSPSSPCSLSSPSWLCCSSGSTGSWSCSSWEQVVGQTWTLSL